MLKIKKITKKAYTLVEIMLAAAIALVLLSSVFYAFHQNIDSWRRGEKKLVLQGEVSLITSRIYYDLKRINPVIYYDQNFDLWVSGEKFKEIKPNVVELFDENQNQADGFERIKFNVYMIEPYGATQTIEYYLKPDPNSFEKKYLKNKFGSAYILIRNVDNNETIVSEHVESLKFFKDISKTSKLTVNIKVTMPPSYKDTKKSDNINLNIKLDSEHVVLRESISKS